MKRVFALLICAVLLLMPIEAASADELTIVHATDMHYLSPALTDYGEAFRYVTENADGKMTEYTPQIMAAFVDEMLALRPDAVVLSGDLTLNGAPESHKELAELLIPLKEAGINVLILPGNHDSGSAAYRFSGEEVLPVQGSRDEDLALIYEQFGPEDALSRDSVSLSYIAEISDKLWLFMLDVNANGTFGKVKDETFLWAEEQLEAAKEKGVTVISVTHQPSIIHNPLFNFGYVVNNSAKLLELFSKYGVEVNLSGHLHMQHIAKNGTLTDIAASSLAVSPHQYGILRVSEGKAMDYEMKALDISQWAERTGQTDEKLLNFAEYSAEFFDGNTRRQTEEMFSALDISAEEKEQMTEFAVRLNAEYFSGARTLGADDPAWELWQKHLPESFFTTYIKSILADGTAAMNYAAFE